jgi:hypothetical protein
MITFFGCAGCTQMMYFLKEKRQTENPEKQAGRDRIFLYLTLSPRKIQSPHVNLKTAFDCAPETGGSIQNAVRGVNY